MSLKAVKCPNCNGPLKPNSSTEILSCSYCNHHFENPRFKRPGSQHGGGQIDGRGVGRIVLLLFLLPSAITVIVAIIVVIVSSTNSVGTQPASPFLEQASAPTAASPADPPVSPEVALEQKLDKYIECMDQAFPRAEQSMERYRSWVNVEKGPTCKERYVTWGLYAMYDYAPPRCQKLVAEANAADPQIPGLQQVAVEFTSAAAALLPVTIAASEYYENKMYRVDDCAKGRALHPQLVSLYDTLQAKYHLLRHNIEHYAKGALDRCVSRTAADPQAAAAHQWALFIKTGGAMLEAFRAEAQKREPSILLIKSQIAALNQVASALQATSDAHRQAAGFDWSHKSDIDEFIEGAVAFLTSEGGKKLGSSARFFRRNGTSLKNLDGTFEKLEVLYNDVLADFENNPYCGSLLPCAGGRCPVR